MSRLSSIELDLRESLAAKDKLAADLSSVNAALADKDSQMTAQQQSLLRLESEREKFTVHRKEVDVLNLKLKSYEDKIKRQEQYMKSRLLKDRSNMCVVPPCAALADGTKLTGL